MLKKRWPLWVAGAMWLVLLGLRLRPVALDVETSTHAAKEASAFVYVELRGEVHHPGIYKVSADSRVFDVFKRAGGLTDHADLSHINQTQTVYDGWLLIVPSHTESTASNLGKLSLNHATADELESLPGIGPATAEAILKARDQAPFKTIDDLLEVPGIGPATLSQIEALITP